MDDPCPQPRRARLNASAREQQQLLEVQALDTRIDQIDHRVATLPEHAQLAALEQRLSGLRDQVVVAETAQTDIGRELVKAEGDVELVRQRVTRDQARLASGQGAPRELESLQHELGSLAKRQSDLEDVELDVMERLESATASAAELRAEREGVVVELAELTAHRDQVVGGLTDERGQAQSTRAELVAPLSGELVTLYEKIRASGGGGGTGAARLHQGRCEGCRLELTPTELARIRTAPEDEVLRCEECRRILVRVPESGL